MVILLYIIFVLAALILTLVVLIQDDQGEGIGGLFGGGSSTPFGSRSGNVLTRFTGIVAAVFLITSVVVGLVNRSTERKEIEGPTTEQVTRERFFAPEPSASPAQSETGTVMEAASPGPVASPTPEASAQ